MAGMAYRKRMLLGGREAVDASCHVHTANLNPGKAFPQKPNVSILNDGNSLKKKKATAKVQRELAYELLNSSAFF